MMMQSAQLPLHIGLRDDATFDNYFEQGNEDLIFALKQQLTNRGEMCLYLWGRKGCGLSHLLQAACHYAQQQEQTCFYLDLNTAEQYDTEMLSGLEHFDLVCLDNIDAIAKQTVWEEAIFHLFNRLRDAGKHLLVAAQQNPQQSPIKLPDLRSRLAWGMVFQCHLLNDEQKISALQMRAEHRGFALSDTVANYLIRHCARDMKTLFELLDKLDQASLVLQRRLTVPLVKTVLAN